MGVNRRGSPDRMDSIRRSPVTVGMMNTLAVAALLGGAALIAGCVPTPTEFAQARFSKGASCPKDRIKLTTVEGPPPPPELGNDRERIAMWRDKNHNPTFLRADGCGKTLTYECTEGSAWNSNISTSCTPTAEANLDELTRRATVDLKCPAASIHAVKGDFRTELDGCGSRALYWFDDGKGDWRVMVVPIPTPVPPPASPATTPAGAAPS